MIISLVQIDMSAIAGTKEMKKLDLFIFYKQRKRVFISSHYQLLLSIMFANFTCFICISLKIKIHLFIDNIHFFFCKSFVLPTFLARWSSFLMIFNNLFRD